jgi:hypothetical protein
LSHEPLVQALVLFDDRGLGVVVDVHETGRHDQAGDVDRIARSRSVRGADEGDATARDADGRNHTGCSSAVQHGAAHEEHIERPVTGGTTHDTEKEESKRQMSIQHHWISGA